jgi:nucleotide-binding universal stress UspA family protein
MREPPPIVVAVDASERALDAIALGGRLAGPGQRLVLVHVRSDDPARTDDIEDLRRLAELTLDGLRDTLDPTIRRQLRVSRRPSIGAAIHDVAREIGAPVIVVGSSHRSPMGRVMAGSVTDAVLDGAPLPVAVAPHGSSDARGRLGEIGCAFDGSPMAHEALAWAAAAARRHEARLRVLMVDEPIAFDHVSTAGAIGYQPASEVLRRSRRRTLERAVATLRPYTEATGNLLGGDAVAELARASDELDLLVVGSRGHGPVRRLILGSVSRGLAHSAACGLVVVPRLRADSGRAGASAAAAGQ